MDNLAWCLVTLILTVCFLVTSGEVFQLSMQSSSEFSCDCVCIALNLNILAYHICDILTFTFFPSLRRDQRYKWSGRLCNLLNIEFAFSFFSEMCFYLPVSARGTGPEWKHPSLVTYLRDIMHSSTINTNFWVSTFQVATPIGYPAADTWKEVQFYSQWNIKFALVFLSGGNDNL